MHASVTMRDLLGWKSRLPCGLFGRSGRGDLGGEQTRRPERKEWRRSRNTSRTKALCGAIRGSRPVGLDWGKADDVGEVTGRRALHPDGIMAQASWDRLAEIASGRTGPQQGFAATCK